MPAIPPPPERITGELVDLREIAGWDIPEVLIAHQDDKQLHRLLGLRRPPTAAHLGREVELEEYERQHGNSVRLTITEPGGRDCRGRVIVEHIDWERASAEVRVWAAPQVRGRGYEQQAAELAVRWLRSGAGIQHVAVTLLT